MHRSLLFALASAAALGFMAAAPASAGTLRYNELNLDQQAGAQAMLGRIEFAANAACGDRAGPMPLAQRAAIRRCVRDKSERAVSDVGNATLTALYYDRRPHITVAGS